MTLFENINMGLLKNSKRKCLLLATVLFIIVILFEKLDIPDTIDTVIIYDTENLSLKTETEIWIEKRQKILSTAPHKKALLFCYMRGGSTFFSELFNQNKEAMFWYEPLDSFYGPTYGLRQWHLPQDIFWHRHRPGNSTLRQIPNWEMDAITDFNHNLLSCNVTGLPVESFVHSGALRSVTNHNLTRCIFHQSQNKTVETCRNQVINYCNGNVARSIRNHCTTHIQNANTVIETYGNLWQRGNNHKRKQLEKTIPPIFLNYSKCRSDYRQKYVESCLPDYKKKCDNTKLITYKGLRITMDSISRMLERDPDMHVIYFIRDPRSIVTSRFGTSLIYRESFRDPVKEAGFLCKKMQQDYNTYKELESKYPGAIKLVKYENLTRNRYTVIKDIYKHLGMEVHQSVYNWITKNEHSKTSGGIFSTRRKNSTQSIDKWKRRNSLAVQKGLTNICRSVLESLGYEL